MILWGQCFLDSFCSDSCNDNTALLGLHQGLPLSLSHSFTTVLMMCSCTQSAEHLTRYLTALRVLQGCSVGGTVQTDPWLAGPWGDPAAQKSSNFSIISLVLLFFSYHSKPFYFFKQNAAKPIVRMPFTVRMEQVFWCMLCWLVGAAGIF